MLLNLGNEEIQDPSAIRQLEANEENNQKENDEFLYYLEQ